MLTICVQVPFVLLTHVFSVVVDHTYIIHTHNNKTQ